MLRSPFAGLSLEGLAICIAALKKNNEPFSEEPLLKLTEQDKTKYQNGQKIYKQICGSVKEKNISALVSELWYDLGYRFETQWNRQTALYHELYDYLFHLAVLADKENQGLAQFISSIQEKRSGEESITDIEIPMERSGAVQLLTIHKSKGLEFPVVFLCCCNKHGKYDSCADVYNSDETGISIKPPLIKIPGIEGLSGNYFYALSAAEKKNKRKAELRRLLYVGMTRAEKELYISGCLDIRKHGQDENKKPITDFSLLVKTYAEKKNKNTCKKYESHETPYDTIIDNDTFFGLLLPALASHIPDEGSGSLPFNIEEIPDFSGEDEEKFLPAAKTLENNEKGLAAFINNTEKYYIAAEEIQTPRLPMKHFSVSALKDIPFKSTEESNASGNSTEIFTVAPEFSGKDSADVFAKVEKLLETYTAIDNTESKKFSAANFGTLAHACAEALFKNKKIEFPAELSGNVEPKDRDTLLNAGKELAARFIDSPLGKIASEAQKRENEYPFRTLLIDSENKEMFINGTIDLCFEDEHTVYVVDFKTDAIENPDDHRVQMACYAHAANELAAIPVKKNCRVFLYYLRTGHAVELSHS